jgi:hypothetical protein
VSLNERYGPCSFLDFVTQHYLMQTKSRLEAEIRMYSLIRGIKRYRSEHSLVHLAARFLGLVDEPLERYEPPIGKRAKEYKPSNASLDVTFLTVYLYLRRTVLMKQHEAVPDANRRFSRVVDLRLKSLPKFATVTEKVGWAGHLSVSSSSMS